MPPGDDGLKSFNNLIIDIRSISGWASKGALAAPLVDLAFGFGPPWPSPLLTPVLSICCELVVLVLVMTLWEGASKRKVRRTVIAFAVLSACALVTYLLLLGNWVFLAPNGTRIVGGFAVLPHLRPVLSPSFSATDALVAAEWHAERIWTGASIMSVRLMLLLAWLVMFGAFIAMLGAFVLGRRKQHWGHPT